MIDHLLKLALEIGAAVVAAVVVNEGIRYFTGQSLLQHMSNWAAPVRDDIIAWAKQHPNEKIRRVVLRVVQGTDNVVSAAARVKIRIFAETGEKAEQVEIGTRSLSRAEFDKMNFDSSGELKLEA